MKYQELYDHALKSEAFVVEFNTNIIPHKGWAIPRDLSPLFIKDEMSHFDVAVDWAQRVSQGSTHFIYVREEHGWRVGHGVVYNDQQFAMGYLMGRGGDFIIDCYTGKKVMRR